MQSIGGRVGAVLSNDGVATEPARQGKTGEMVTSDCHARWHEAVSRGRCFYSSIAAAGVAPGTAISTTPPFILENPSGSNVILSLLAGFIGYISGTLGAGVVVWTGMVDVKKAALTGGTALAVNNALIGSNVKPACNANTGGTLGATPLILRPAWTLSAFLASTAIAPFTMVPDNVDGGIEVAPGAAIALQEIGAGGSTPLVVFAALWEEVPTA